MIFDDTSIIRLKAEDGRFIVTERDTIAAIFRLVPGLFLAGTGALVLYVLICAGGGLRPVGTLPMRICGWAVISLLVTALGLVPLCSGCVLILARQRYIFNSHRQCLQSQLVVYGLPVWTRTFSLSRFESMAVEHRRVGPFAGRWLFVVYLKGRTKQVDLAAFHSRQAAMTLAADMAVQIHLPVVEMAP